MVYHPHSKRKYTLFSMELSPHSKSVLAYCMYPSLMLSDSLCGAFTKPYSQLCLKFNTTNSIRPVELETRVASQGTYHKLLD